MTMSDPILVVGPSGIGKSTITRRWHRAKGGGERVNLDSLVVQACVSRGLAHTELGSLYRALGPDKFLDIGMEALFEVERPAPTVVDVGAGFQVAAKAATFAERYPTVCLIADPSTAYERCRQRGYKRSAEVYHRSEFSAARRQVYGAADISIDTTELTEDETLERFGRAVKVLSERR